MHVPKNNLPQNPRGDEVLLSASGPAAAYLGTDLMTAAPARLARILYDAAIRLCRQGIDAIDDGNVSLAVDRIGRAQSTLAQLQRLSSGGAAEGWDRLYGRLNGELVEAAAYRNREAVTAIIATLTDRRPQWQQFLHTMQDRLAAAGNGGWVG